LPWLDGLSAGMMRKEIRPRTEEIASFKELDEFLRLPVRNYSAGMRTRLALAVSTSITPNILLLDEGIGAGDSSFLDKARRRLDSFTAEAGIVVLVSHSPDLIFSLCSTAVLMEHGRIVTVGETAWVMEQYEQHTTAEQQMGQAQSTR